MNVEELKKQIEINKDKEKRVADKLRKIQRTIADQEKLLLELEKK